jgi:hypothetical protein
MRVKWTEYVDMPEEYWERVAEGGEAWLDLSHHYEGEVIGTVRAWGETRLVVMLDTGKVREVAASRVQAAK